MVKLQLLMLYSSFIGTFLVNMYISDLESPLYCKAVKLFKTTKNVKHF